MVSPEFQVLEYGVFDSNIAFPKTKTTRLRQVTCYELELYTADHPGQSCIDGVWHPIRRGIFICAKPGQQRKSKLPFRCNYIHLQTQDPMLTSLLDQLPERFELWQLGELEEIFLQMLTAEAAPEKEGQLLLCELVMRLLRYLSRYGQPSYETDTAKGNIHRSALLEIEAYIRENLDQALPLAALALRCNLSPVYFHTVFTHYFQKTPAKYILECRIAAAKTALQADGCDISQLAQQCGFSSQSYFSSKFKQATGKTPTQYRKEMLGRLQP